MELSSYQSRRFIVEITTADSERGHPSCGMEESRLSGLLNSLLKICSQGRFLLVLNSGHFPGQGEMFTVPLGERRSHKEGVCTTKMKVVSCVSFPFLDQRSTVDSLGGGNVIYTHHFTGFHPCLLGSVALSSKWRSLPWWMVEAEGRSTSRHLVIEGRERLGLGCQGHPSL